MIRLLRNGNVSCRAHGFLFFFFFCSSSGLHVHYVLHRVRCLVTKFGSFLDSVNKVKMSERTLNAVRNVTKTPCVKPNISITITERKGAFGSCQSCTVVEVLRTIQ